jgi:hypothetical protein
MPARLKLVLFRLFSMLIGMVLLMGAAEIILRFLPVTESFYSLPVNAQNPIFRCQPNRTVLWSAFWNFSMRNVIRMNNYGFASNIDYAPDNTRPLLAIVGDSFMEAIATPWPQTGAGRLQQCFADCVRVYTFAKSGAPMSQYLVYAEYAKQTFRPHGFVIVIVANDFDESLLKYKESPHGFHYFVRDTSDKAALQRVDYQVSFWKKMVRQSALAMYLTVNLYVPKFYYLARHHLFAEKFVGNTLAKADSVRMAKSRWVVDNFLSLLPAKAGLDSSHILFVIDGVRPQLYQEEALRIAAPSYFGQMRQYFIESAVARGFEVIDMQPIFVAHYRRHGQRFEYARDNHWNSLGHALFADAVRQSQMIKRTYTFH